MKASPVVVALFFFVVATLTPLAHAADERPNIVLIMVDDFGYECVGANGGTSYATPNVDRLAAEGMRFEHGYAQPLCTPTRVQLMTGQYNKRNYERFGLLPGEQTTFANLLRAVGYRTCIVGKWQLSHGFDGPGRFGFDEYCLWQLTRRPPRYANPGIEINGRAFDYDDGQYGPDVVNGYALDFISRHADRPFLLYYPMILTHSPYQPTPDSDDWEPTTSGERAKQHDRHFGEMVAYMDKMVGNVVAKLDELGLREKTLILFTGDNGTGRGMVSRMGDIEVIGGKGTMTDAGTHVPLVANWRGAIAGDGVSRDLVDTTDFLPTLCEAAGVPLPTDVALDGRSFLPQLRGEAGNPREWLYCWYSPNQGEIDVPREFARDHRYKLFGDGSFFEVDSRHFTEKRLAADALSGEAAAARDRLAAVLDKFKDARPPELASAEASGWIELFNGRDLSGWRPNLYPDSFTIVDGAIRACSTSETNRSHLFYVGPSGEDFVAFKNFELEAVVRGEPNANSGIFFHTDDSVRDARMHLAKGYEVQLNSSPKEARKTGSLYAIVDVPASPVDEREWFKIRMRVEGKRIRVFVNDKKVVDYVEPAGVERPPQRAGRLIDRNGGAIALQAHDPGSVFYFRQIRIRQLDARG